MGRALGELWVALVFYGTKSKLAEEGMLKRQYHL
ncbi:hypothetical protein J2S16_004270 [Cytobacillus kochii]|nr:hypothetical protein [Cytobacillus kochii]